MLKHAKGITVKELKEYLNGIEDDSIIKVYDCADSKFVDTFIIDSFKCIDDGQNKTLIYI